MRYQHSSVSRALRSAVLCGVLFGSVGCNLLKNLPGIPNLQGPAPMSVGGNWQMDLMDSSGNVASVATGFLQQSGGNITGSLDLNGCNSNSSSVTGTVGGNNGPNAISLSVNVDNQTLSIVGSGIGTVTPGNAIEGNYTVGATPCAISGLTATVSGQQINPVSGGFHGSLQPKNGTPLNISGTVTQGSNTSGSSSAPVTGTATVSGSTCFNSVNLSGSISGTAVQWQIASADGSQVAQMSSTPITAAGQIGTGSPGSYTVTQLSGTYTVSSGSCSGDSGTFTVTFP